MDGQSQVDASKLSTSDQKELNQFLMNEAQRSTIQQSKLEKDFPCVNIDPHSCRYFTSFHFLFICIFGFSF